VDVAVAALLLGPIPLNAMPHTATATERLDVQVQEIAGPRRRPRDLRMNNVFSIHN
jgi:hypothetical protein